MCPGRGALKGRVAKTVELGRSVTLRASVVCDADKCTSLGGPPHVSGNTDFSRSLGAGTCRDCVDRVGAEAEDLRRVTRALLGRRILMKPSTSAGAFLLIACCAPLVAGTKPTAEELIKRHREEALNGAVLPAGQVREVRGSAQL